MRVVIGLSLQNMLKKLILILLIIIFMFSFQTKVILCKSPIHLYKVLSIDLHSFLILLDDLHDMPKSGQGIGPVDCTDYDFLDFISQDGHLVLKVLVRDSS